MVAARKLHAVQVGVYMHPNDHEAWLDVRGPSLHVYRFKFDAADLPRVAAHRWYFHQGNRSVAAKALIDGKWVKLHRWLIGAPKGEEVDHVNRDPFDCTRENLKLANRFHQERNKGAMRHSSTGMRGVIPQSGRFEARIQYKGKRYYLGTFEKDWHARLAYILAEHRLIHA